MTAGCPCISKVPSPAGDCTPTTVHTYFYTSFIWGGVVWIDNTNRASGTFSASTCVCVCVCLRERERESNHLYARSMYIVKVHFKQCSNVWSSLSVGEKHFTPASSACVSQLVSLLNRQSTSRVSLPIQRILSMRISPEPCP